jgi:serine/threonine-protein kinase
MPGPTSHSDSDLDRTETVEVVAPPDPSAPSASTSSGAASEPTTDHEEGNSSPAPGLDFSPQPGIPETRPAIRVVGPSRSLGFTGDGAAPSAGTSDGPLAFLREPTDPAPFSVAGYRLVRALGQGGMAEVHLAEREGAHGVAIRCVLKTVLPNRLDDPRFSAKFLDEARICAKLRHPNVVAVLDFGRAEDRLFLAMEWVDGLDVAELIRSTHRRRVDVPLPHALFILRETLQGLHHAHTATDDDGSPLSVIHRDISPGNILISRQGAVKLSDFGVAVGAVAQASEPRRTLAGKLHYFAPELVSGRGYASERTDIWALGVTFWEILSGRPMFDRKAKWPELSHSILSFQPKSLFEDDLTQTEGIERLVSRALAPQPEDRYPSALAFLEDVNDYCYEAGIRLLDAHFARFIERTLELRATQDASLVAAAKKVLE